MTKEKLSAIIGIRVYPSWKKEAIKEAKRKGISLSDLIYQCLESGWDIVVKDNVKQDNR